MTRITSNISEDLRASLRLRGQPVGLTWSDFIFAVQKLGVRPETHIASIDYGTSQDGTGRIVVDVTPEGAEIREVRGA